MRLNRPPARPPYSDQGSGGMGGMGGIGVAITSPAFPNPSTPPTKAAPLGASDKIERLAQGRLGVPEYWLINLILKPRLSGYLTRIVTAIIACPRTLWIC